MPYAVLDAGGKTVATGTVDGARVTLDADTYRVVAQTNPPRTIDGVVASTERETSAALPRAGDWPISLIVGVARPRRGVGRRGLLR